LEGSSIDNGIVLLSESSDWMDVLALGMTGSLGAGGLGQGLLQVLELYGSRESVDRLTTLPVVVIGPIDLFIHCNKDMCESFFSFLKRTYQIQPPC
jgi:hypothetical protein